MNLSDEDKRLSQTLADWRLAPRRDPAFRTGVWARIAAARNGDSWAGYARAHTALLTSAMALALLVGAWAGREQARSRVAADRAELAQMYVQALDARAMTMP